MLNNLHADIEFEVRKSMDRPGIYDGQLEISQKFYFLFGYVVSCAGWSLGLVCWLVDLSSIDLSPFWSENGHHNSGSPSWVLLICCP